jgi:3-methylcrotonyl-CoA carboxylase beta subunit
MRRIVSSSSTFTAASSRQPARTIAGLVAEPEISASIKAQRLKRPQRDLDRLARQNKMFVRDRIEMLLDPGTPFLELSTLAANHGL